MRNLPFVFLVVLSAIAAQDRNRFPVAFEPNRGQAPAGVSYLAQGRQYTLLFDSAGARLRAPGTDVHMRFAGASRSATVQAEGLLAGTANYLRGNDPSKWHTRIPTYANIRYRNLYPGIDLLCHGNQGDFQYDFIVSPGARPSAIRLEFTGIDRLKIGDSGELVLEAAGRRIVHRPPIVYQETDGKREPVQGRYVLQGDRRASFALGRYDKRRPLIIDPTLVYSTFVGDVYQISGSGVTVDSGGNAYIAGSRVDPSYGDWDFFLFKLDPTGAQRLNSVSFGGSYDDTCDAIALDPAGNVYVTGGTQSPDMPVGGTIFQRVLRGSYNAYVAAITADFSSFVFATFLGGSSGDEGFAIAVDASRNVFVAGGAGSTDFPTGSSAYQRANAGGVDAFLTKFSATGTALFSTLLGGSGNDTGYGLAVDASGNAYITGGTASANLPVTAGAYRNARAGVSDAFVSKFDSTGYLLYSTYFGGSGEDTATGIAVDSSGSAFLAGVSSSTDLPTSPTGKQRAPGGRQDGFVAKLDSTGSSLAWSTYLGGSGEDSANAIALDSTGAVFVTGSTDSANFPLTSDAYQSSLGVKSVGFFSQLSPDGASLLYSTLFGGSGGDTPMSIVAGCSTGVYITGATYSTDFPVTAGAYGSKFTGQQDAFIVRFGGANSPPAISAGGVVNGANFASGPVAPGSLISIFGSSLSLLSLSAGVVPLPNTLGAVSFTVNGVQAPLFYVSPTQINAQLPFEIQPGTAQVVVNTCGSASSAMPVNVTTSAPSVFQTASGHASAQNLPDYSINDSAHPAKPGSVVIVYLTGIGPVTNQPATGNVAPASGVPISTATLPYAASIGGQAAPVTFLGLTPGYGVLAQANITVPIVPAGEQPLVISVGGVASKSAVISVGAQ